jgi:imidazolonepropionase-like amidohydrolase
VGSALGITGGHCDDTGFIPGVMELGPEDGVADGLDEVVKAVRYQIKHGARWIKICATAGVLSLEGSVGAQQYSKEEMQAIVEEARRHDVRVMAHAHGTEGIIAASEAGVASIEHGSILNDEAIRIMKGQGTYLVPTLWVGPLMPEGAPVEMIRKNDEMMRHVSHSIRMAVRAGVKIAFGTDAGVFPHGENAREFRALVEAGLSPVEAIRTATIHAAELLEAKDRGLLAPGLLADIIAVPSNPLDDVRALEQVSFVMKGGKIFKKPAAAADPRR